MGGIIAYSDDIKIRHLGVRKSTIQKHGAVSKQTAVAMAKGARKKFGADYAVSATGIAGPGGGTKEKPVGLIYIAVSGPKGDACRRLDLATGRNANRQRTVSEALSLLYECLTKDALASPRKFK